MGEFADALNPFLGENESSRIRAALSDRKQTPEPRPRKKRVPKIAALPKHVVIPDTQVRPDVPTAHLEWIGQYIADEFAGEDLTIIHLGDHWDMPSLSSYDAGKKQMEGRRVVADIFAGNDGFALLDAPISAVPKWNPRKVLLRGNHENRITRAIDSDPQLEGLLSLDLLDSRGWEVHDFLEVVEIDGVSLSHYFYNPMTGKPYGGQNIDTRLKTIGHSFTMGHQQGLGYGIRNVLGQMHHGLVAGSCLTPDHKVLTADLRYVELGDVGVGDQLVSFDEDVLESPRRGRRYKTGTVQAVKRAEAEVFAVTLEDGKQFRVTADHRWLTRIGGPSAQRVGETYWWRTTEKLRVGTRVPRLLDEWETLDSYDAGWLAGIYDGEGCLTTRVTTGGIVCNLVLSQKKGAVLDHATEILESLLGLAGISHQNQRGVSSLRVKGGVRRIAKVLGSVRPVRLLPKFRPEHLGQMMTNENVRITSIEPIGVREVVQIDIDAKTMIVEGYPHHNCYLHDEDYKGPQGNAHWRGIVVCNQVENGSYDPSFISLDYLCRRYEGIRLIEFMEKQ